MILRSVFVGALLSFAIFAAAAPIPGGGGVVFLPTNLDFEPEVEDATHPLSCLRVALKAQGLEVDLPTLRSLSGEVWVPLFQTPGSVREPIRELMAADPLAHVSEALGLEAEWHMDLGQAEVMQLFRAELRERRAPIVPFLHRPTARIGWNLVVGVESERNGVMICDMAMPRERVTLSMPSQWSGPVPGPTQWATNPIFTVDAQGATELPPDVHMLRASMRGWQQQTTTEGLTIPTHRGARNFMGDDHTGAAVISGAQAAMSMANEIAALETLDSYAMLWRTCTLVPLHQDRNQAAEEFLVGLEGLDSDIAAKRDRLVAALRDETGTIRHLMNLMWNESFDDGMTARDLLDRIVLDPPLIADVDAVSPTQRELLLIAVERNPQVWDIEMASTPFGAILIIDSPDQRQRVWDLFEQLAAQMETTHTRAGELAEAVGVSAGASP